MTGTAKSKRRDWTLMTKTRAGVVSIVRELTEEEAMRAYDRLDPWYGVTGIYVQVHKDFGGGDDGYWARLPTRLTGDPNDLDIREIFGPEGWSNVSESRWPHKTVVWTDKQGNILPDEMQDNPFAAKWCRPRRTGEAQ